jgi:hypothetical protein
MLKTLASMPLYKGELPNKVYNSKTLIPVNYGQLDKREEIGWSALDLGRLAIWLNIVGTKYPKMRSQTEAVWKHWQIKRLVKNGQMYGTSVIAGQEQYTQEGRLGYENYGAYGLKLWGLDVKKALDYTSNTDFVDLYGQGVPYDLRFLSAKAAVGWHVLYNTAYTDKLFNFVQTQLKSDQGWYNGFYESLNQPNKALTANNNGVILESLLYKKVGKPLTVWAGIKE